MRDLERHGGQRALRRVAEPLVAADPVLALMPALHVPAALGHRVALDRLILERLALGHPIAQIAGLEIKIERPPGGVGGQHALGVGGGEEGEEAKTVAAIDSAPGLSTHRMSVSIWPKCTFDNHSRCRI